MSREIFGKTIARAARVLPAAILALILGGPGAANAEEGTAEAFSSWSARGQIYPTAPGELTFVGVFNGIFYLKEADDRFDSGLMTCPASISLAPETAALSGRGKCAILTPDNQQIFGAFECQGTYTKGCSGTFELTGGTGVFEGLKGSGPVHFQSAIQKAAAVAGNIVNEEAAGIAYWPALKYSFPEE